MRIEQIRGTVWNIHYVTLNFRDMNRTTSLVESVYVATSKMKDSSFMHFGNLRVNFCSTCRIHFFQRNLKFILCEKYSKFADLPRHIRALYVFAMSISVFMVSAKITSLTNFLNGPRMFIICVSFMGLNYFFFFQSEQLSKTTEN